MRSHALNLGLIFLFVSSTITGAFAAQKKTDSSACGTSTVHLTGPAFLTTPIGIIEAEPPPGWALDKTQNNPFYFIKVGETYHNARTLIYINVQHLDVPFSLALTRDEREFKEHCPSAGIENTSQPDILEQGCERKTQIFFCNRRQHPYVDMDTKISFGDMLVNVVLSADNPQEISRYRKDYLFLLMHLSFVE